MHILMWILLVLFLLRDAMLILFLAQTIKWLKFQKKELSNLPRKLHREIYILIPVLREQSRIIETLKYFLKYFNSVKVHIIVITTDREYEKKINGLSTQKVIAKFINENKLEGRIKLINYRGKGKTAGQFNYALSGIKDNDSFIATYNADSKPNPKTLLVLERELEKYPNAQVFQQPAVFLKNFDEINKSFLKRVFLQTAAVLQTEYSLIHEIPAFLRQSLSRNHLLLTYASTYCISHGLIINTGLLKSVGGFPEKTITEDIFLGFLLRSKSVPIYPFPILENADSPTTLKGLWQQKYVWFWGPMRYPSYFNYVRRNSKKLKVTNLKIPLLLMLQGLWSALGWISIGFVIPVILIESILVRNTTIVLLLLASILLSYPLRFVIISSLIPFLYETTGQVHKRISNINIFLIGITSIPFMIFHSIPPFFSIAREIGHNFWGKEIYKPKTDD